jgi:hypothetical protein
MFYNIAFASAGRTGTRYREKALASADLTGTSAGGTDLAARTTGGSASMTGRTYLIAGICNFSLGPKYGILKGYL